MNAFLQAGNYIIHLVFFLYMVAVLGRFLLQIARGDFYNSFSQALVKITNPLLVPLRRVIPGFKGADFASLVLALLVETAAFFLLIFLHGQTQLLTMPLPIIIWLIVGVFWMCLRIYFWAMVVLVISNIMMMLTQSHALLPVYQYTSTLCDPILAPIRRKIPPIGMFDLSVLVAFVGITIIEFFIVELGAPKILFIAY